MLARGLSCKVITSNVACLSSTNRYIFPRIHVDQLIALATSKVASMTPKTRSRFLSQACSSQCPIAEEFSYKQVRLEPGLYVVATPIGNLEDITLRAIRVLKSADLVLCEDTRHSGILLRHYGINSPLLSYHKFNESQRDQHVYERLKQGEVIALISDAGTPGYSDPGSQLVKLCIDGNVPVFPIPGPCAGTAALSASGLPMDEFTFVGFLPKHTASRRDRLAIAANEPRTQIFYVPPHKLSQFLEEASLCFGDSRLCVLAREITKVHEEFWRGSLGEARENFLNNPPKGEITMLIEGKLEQPVETISEAKLEKDLEDLLSGGHSLSETVKVVAEGSSTKKKLVYSIALKKFRRNESDENAN